MLQHSCFRCSWICWTRSNGIRFSRRVGFVFCSRYCSCTCRIPSIIGSLYSSIPVRTSNALSNVFRVCKLWMDRVCSRMSACACENQWRPHSPSSFVYRFESPFAYVFKLLSASLGRLRRMASVISDRSSRMLGCARAGMANGNECRQKRVWNCSKDCDRISVRKSISDFAACWVVRCCEHGGGRISRDVFHVQLSQTLFLFAFFSPCLLFVSFVKKAPFFKACRKIRLPLLPN
jgi:hypothetical protein